MDTRAFDFTVIFSVVPDLLSYLDVTLAVALASIVLGSLWGVAISGAKVAGGKALRGLAHGYTYVMRCTPSIVLLFIVFYDGASPVFYISEFGWNTSYLFLLLLLIYINTESNKKWRYRFDPFFMLIPAFTIGMCIFYMQWGDYLSNMVTAVLMMGLIWHAFYGLKVLRKRPEQGMERRTIFLVTLLFCATEYALWTSSCFWMGETLLNIYYWFDILLSFSFVLFLPALRKAVGE